MRGNRKGDGRYIFIPPTSQPAAESRRHKAIRRLKLIKESIQQLEDERLDIQAEIDALNKYVKKNRRPTRRQVEVQSFGDYDSAEQATEDNDFTDAVGRDPWGDDQ